MPLDQFCGFVGLPGCEDDGCQLPDVDVCWHGALTDVCESWGGDLCSPPPTAPLFRFKPASDEQA